MFKQKPTYEFLISDWSSDVCSSDLHPDEASRQPAGRVRQASWLSLYQLLPVHQRRHPDIQPLPSADVFPPARTSTQLLTCAACLLQQIAPLSDREAHVTQAEAAPAIFRGMLLPPVWPARRQGVGTRDRKNTRLNSSH